MVVVVVVVVVVVEYEVNFSVMRSWLDIGLKHSHDFNELLTSTNIMFSCNF